MAYAIHDATALYRRLGACERGDRELEARGITCSSSRRNVFVQRGSFIFKWTVDFILYHLARLFLGFSRMRPVVRSRYILDTKSDYWSSEF